MEPTEETVLKRYDYIDTPQTYNEMPITYKTHLNEEIMAKIRDGFKNYLYRPFVLSDERLLSIYLRFTYLASTSFNSSL